MKLYNVKEISTGRVLLETNDIEEARAYMAQHNDILRKPGRSRGEPEREAFIQYNNVKDVERVHRATKSRTSDYIEGLFTDGRLTFKRDHNVSIAEQVRNNLAACQILQKLDNFSEVY